MSQSSSPDDPDRPAPPDQQPETDSASRNRDAEAAVDQAMQADDPSPGKSAGSPGLAGELKLANDRVLRAQAELENFRKRIRRDMDEQLKYAALPLIRDLLPVIDNLERALQATEGKESPGGVLDGIRIVVQQLQAVLQQHHCQRIEAVGQPFDPHLHEALAQEPSDSPAGRVTRVMQVGYQLHDRVIRPSQVFVSTGPAAPPQ